MSNLTGKPHYRASIRQDPNGQGGALVIERLDDGEELFRLARRSQVQLKYGGQIGNFSVTDLAVINGKSLSTLLPIDKESAKLCDRVRREAPTKVTVETDGKVQEFWLGKEEPEFSVIPWPVDDYVLS